ncbi:hypothetical protein OEW28_00650 [Defluviimonas sp. WL0002]|uniref:Uncharacterized protein n=1 Tax=Albidovulum marisflavi TaxID=2984159 RepID=A0ABT2Z7M1_9RHOB|nr:hypothetical protein [Defluviimonas sp. WL0002]MCV2867133.1 hypothetical protein [Defluviimonas sp. WL0002]
MFKTILLSAFTVAALATTGLVATSAGPAFAEGDVVCNGGGGGCPRKKGNNGWGNGDQPAPGGSLPNNNAENGPGGNPD